MPIISLTLTEKTIYQHLLTAATEAIPTLAEALSAASIIRKEATPFYSLLYLEPKPLPPSLPRVPLEVRFFGPWGAPIQCLLHVLDGTLHMIEISARILLRCQRQSPCKIPKSSTTQRRFNDRQSTGFHHLPIERKTGFHMAQTLWHSLLGGG